MANARKYLTGSLNADDIPDDGVIYTLAGDCEKEFEEGTKLAVTFEEIGKFLVLNKTNLNTLIDAFGADTAGWVGKKVRLVKEPTQFGRKEVLGVRIHIV